LNKAHAAISLGTSNTYCYDDPNGNMVRRTIGETVYKLDNETFLVVKGKEVTLSMGENKTGCWGISLNRERGVCH